MRFVFRFIPNEKLLFFFYLFFTFLGTFFLISQIFVIANIASFTINIEKVKLISENSFLVSESSDLWEFLFQAIEIYRSEGNIGLTKYIISLENTTFILLLALIILGFTFISQAVLFLKDFIANYFSKKVGAHVRKHFFGRMIYLPIGFFRQKQSGDLISRATNDVKAIEDDLNSFFEYGFFGVIFCLTGFAILIYLNAKFSVILFITIPIVVLLINFTSKTFKKITLGIQEKLSDLTNQYHKVIYAIDVIKIFTKEEFEKNKFQKEIKNYLKKIKKQIFLDKMNRPINEILIIFIVLVIVIYGSNLIWQDEITIDTLLTFILVLVYISQYIQRVNYAFFFVKTRMKVSAKRLSETLYQHKLEDVHQHREKSYSLDGSLEFKKVNFSYDKNILKHNLKNINFKIKAGELVALVGSSGHGKSTLLSLIPLLLTPDEGEIYFNDVSHQEINLRKLREHIAIVTQENILFPGTIEENIAYGKEGPHDFNEIQKAARLAYIHDFISKLASGYETVIGERGVKLSGGQRQRLCLARAIYKNPKILLLDEATSSLDSESEKKVQLALKKNFFNKITTFIVSHRLSTISNANKILLLKDGEIKERGTHKSLWKKKKLYYQLFKSQLQKKKP